MRTRWQLLVGLALGFVFAGLSSYDGPSLQGQVFQPEIRRTPVRSEEPVLPAAVPESGLPHALYRESLRFQVLQMEDRRLYLLDTGTGQLWHLGNQQWVVYARAPRAPAIP